MAIDPTWKVRPAVPDDADAIARIQADALGRAVPGSGIDEAAVRASWRATLSQPAPDGFLVAVAMHGEAVAGFVLAGPAEEIAGEPDEGGRGVEVPQVNATTKSTPGRPTFEDFKAGRDGSEAEAGETAEPKAARVPAGTEILALEVDPNFTRSGHASRLLNAVVDLLDPASLRIWVTPGDEARVRFAESAGFRPAGVRRELDGPDGAIGQHLWWAALPDEAHDG